MEEQLKKILEEVAILKLQINVLTKEDFTRRMEAIRGAAQQAQESLKALREEHKEELEWAKVAAKKKK